MDDPYLASLGALWCPECHCNFGHAAGCPQEEPEVLRSCADGCNGCEDCTDYHDEDDE